MGDMFIKWWWGGDPDERDELSGMSRRDIYHVQKSWTPIYANATGNGFLMFKRLFEADPVSKTFFKPIARATEAEMASSMYFRAHLINIMASLNTSIQNLDKPEMVKLLMHKLGDAHRRLKIEKRQFWVFKDVLVNILKDELKLSDDVIVSWDRYITFIYEHILPRLQS
ncbi:unnamed protein product [Chrysodeixis includens]|uniref:Globin domain-containing protein n=1 Tax=Chrysodeixis includens TaxID=689277 RepID=A0A9P0BKV5_CHRIL|nr:unnamed protein product [Chrysodeixis includens]